jgi:hypothetical protein
LRYLKGPAATWNFRRSIKEEEEPLLFGYLGVFLENQCDSNFCQYFDLDYIHSFRQTNGLVITVQKWAKIELITLVPGFRVVPPQLRHQAQRFRKCFDIGIEAKTILPKHSPATFFR